jgi:membrane-bound lytic murein transglycosylase D
VTIKGGSVSARHVLILILCGGLLVVAACAPQYTSRAKPEQPEPLHDPKALERALDRGEAAYDVGVDYFVQGKLDSAALYFDRAVTVLSRDLDWSQEENLLADRRVLLHKCHYFLERIPDEVVRLTPSIETGDLEPLEPAYPPVEIVRNSRVERWIAYFTGSGREDLIRWVHRSGRYREAVLGILEEEGLPPELINLALIESGFNPKAHSRAHAVGMWQFIESTGRIYDLRIDWWVDERKDPMKSTRAAAHYLRDLYIALDSWPLALAAYNCGQGGVERALKKARSCDFWDLNLKRETSDYVPKFMAACIIMSDPEAYGLDFTFESSLRYDRIEVEPKTRLSAIARSCGVAEAVVEDLNPHILQGCAPDGKSGYPIRIPMGTLEVCRAELAGIPAGDRISDVTEVTIIKHRVRSGDTLSEIAERYDASVREVALANGISNQNRIRIGQVLSIPVRGYHASPENPGIHTVRKNETLSSIAAMYRVKTSDLARWNNLRSQHLIYAGQRLIVSGDFEPGHSTLVHRVRRGETLGSIAGTYKTSLAEILAANNLGSGDVIYPDQKIRIPGAASEVTGEASSVHRVREGDTISEIARKHGVSVKSVLEANNLSSTDRIFPGQDLVIAASAGGHSSPEMIVHEVTPGETVYSIARKYAASWQEVLRGNNLDEHDLIHPGQKLMIAAGAPPADRTVIHTVASGENVSLIARKYGVSVDDVLRFNGIGRNQMIHPGQKMKIPTR